MANIDLKNFVDINIQSHIPNIINGTRNTMVLFTDEGSSSTPIDLYSYDEAIAELNATTYADTLKYLNIFFANGGVGCRVIGNTASLTKALITALDNEYIVVASCGSSYSDLCTLVDTLNADTSIYGINEKIILACTSSVDTTARKNLAVKYSTVLGAEMSIGAYLTQIDIYGVNTVKDYCYTTESEIAEENTLDDATYKSIISNNMNVEVKLAGAIRNCGGNCKDGQEITNNFVRIVLHQTLTESLIQLLTTKIKNSSGIAQIYTTISQELNHYITNGYLVTDKSWTDATLKINVGGVDYTIIEKGTALTAGYSITVLPYSSLTDQEKAEHKAPYIYIIVATQYGIRVIQLDGETF